MAKDNNIQIDKTMFQDMVRRLQDLERDVGALERASVRQDGQLGNLGTQNEDHETRLNEMRTRQNTFESNLFKLQRLTGERVKRYCHICGTELVAISYDTWMICANTGRIDHE